jgi:hypothetical protein
VAGITYLRYKPKRKPRTDTHPYLISTVTAMLAGKAMAAGDITPT